MTEPLEQLASPDDIASLIATFSELPVCVDWQSEADPANFWNVDPVGDAEIDTEVGALMAAQAIRYALKYSRPILITRMLESMIRRGRFGPMEWGFTSAIARSAAVGAQN